MPDTAAPTMTPSARVIFRTRRKWLLLSTFLIAFCIAVTILHAIHGTHVGAQKLAAKMLAQGYAERIQERLQTALVSTYVLGSTVKQANGSIPNFEHVAAELMTMFPGVSALQLAPDGVIQEIYPRAGNEAALGHDLLADRTRNREAAAAITTQQLTLAGPFNLVQGGVGAVGRLPIFLTNERGENHFWGFANALIRIPTLLEAAGVNGLIKAGYRYELWRVHPDTEERQIFAHSGQGAPVSPVEYVITVYNGRWILSLAPDQGWVSSADYIEIYGFGLLAALLVTLLQYLSLWALLRGNDHAAPQEEPPSPANDG